MRLPQESPALVGTRRSIAAREAFTNVFTELARAKRNWQLVAFTLAAGVVLLSIANLRLATSARVVPYVVQVDRFGQVAATGRADRAVTPDQRLIASQLAQFVRAVRTVLPASAAAAQTELVQRGYAFATPEAAAFLNEYFTDPRHDPRVLGARLTRQIDVTTVLRLPGSDTWRLRWTETERGTQGDTPGRAAIWEAYLTVRLIPPVTAETVEDNPLGIYVASISWTRVAESAADSLPALNRDTTPSTRDTGATP